MEQARTFETFKSLKAEPKCRQDSQQMPRAVSQQGPVLQVSQKIFIAIVAIDHCSAKLLVKLAKKSH